MSAIMMTVVNLPRNERFKSKWTMILGVIPGPAEPKIHINSSELIVDHLLILWNGLPLHPNGNAVNVVPF